MKTLLSLNVIACIITIAHSYEVHDSRTTVSGSKASLQAKPDALKRATVFPYTQLLASPVRYQPYMLPTPRSRPPSTTQMSPMDIGSKDNIKHDMIYQKIEGKLGFGEKLTAKKMEKVNGRSVGGFGASSVDMKKVPKRFKNSLMFSV